MNLQRLMLEDEPYVAPGFKSPGKLHLHIVTRFRWKGNNTLGIFSIFPLFLEMYEDSYTRNPNIWEQDNKESDYTKYNNIRPLHGE